MDNSLASGGCAKTGDRNLGIHRNQRQQIRAFQSGKRTEQEELRDEEAADALTDG